jgi:manganese transport protein
MAIFLQVISARLGIVAGKDLAQACRDWAPRWTRYPNWIFCEIAIGACDLAEVLGSAVAINLLFHIPIFWAVVITACDVFLLLALQRYGLRMIESVILVLIATIGVCFFIELFVLPATIPNFREMASALANPGFRHIGMSTVAIGIIGATVMPHNLYLHSALVQSRKVERKPESIRAAIKFNTIDSVVALTIAFFINAAILVLAASVFYGKESVTVGSEVYAFNEETDWIRVAFLTLAPLLGTALASVLFAVALLASGQSSTITGTLAGQVVMEGFMEWRIRPWVRRLVTRLLAILPAIFIIGVRGEGSINDLLVLSQVVLALQLPFAMFPLLYFTSRKKFLGEWRNNWLLLAAGWASAFLITAMDLYGLPDALSEYFLRDHYFFIDATVKPHNRLTFFGSYRWNKDRSLNGVVVPPLSTTTLLLGAYPIDFKTPEVRASVRLSRYLDWNIGYQYYDYSEEPVQNIQWAVPFQNYKAHMPYMSLRIYLGKAAGDR